MSFAFDEEDEEEDPPPQPHNSAAVPIQAIRHLPQCSPSIARPQFVKSSTRLEGEHEQWCCPYVWGVDTAAGRGFALLVSATN
jgi:hypothetical protein